MKALSLTQPMAWAVFHGKDIENREWPTKYRGRVYIHASMKFNEEHYRWIVENDNRLVTNIPEKESPEFVHGAIIGEVTIVDCTKYHGSRWAFNDQYNLVLKDPELYARPVKCRGQLGFFNVSPQVEADIRQMKFESDGGQVDYDNDCAP